MSGVGLVRQSVMHKVLGYDPRKVLTPDQIAEGSALMEMCCAEAGYPPLVDRDEDQDGPLIYVVGVPEDVLMQAARLVAQRFGLEPTEQSGEPQAESR